MANGAENNRINFTVDVNNLYQEENYTDLKVASIRQLTPVTADGNKDDSRTPVFVGNTSVMTPEGPIPLQAMLPANNLKEAFEAFPEAMKASLEKTIEQLEKMQREQNTKGDSRIIVPGR